MNKQELIDELAKYVKRYENAMDGYSQGKYGAYKVSLKLMKRLNEPNITDEQAWNKIAEAYPESAQSLRNTLDNAVFGKVGEPQKPVVPKFVAEFYEDKKDDLDFAIYEAAAHSIKVVGYEIYPEGFMDWFVLATNHPIETLIRMKDGYEIEKEPMYRVKLGEGYFVEYQGRGALIIPDGNKDIKIFDSKSDAERTASTIGGTLEEVAEG
ncbi:DUF1642 domain-containing protein [Enterococcus lactis]|uniref:DUF1642 domain-containing protein n=1 Tax=Enterococcus lactis TaxID=357441 RepID=UPI0040424BBD